MYQITCNDLVLYDDRLDDYVLVNPKLTMEVNKVSSASFKIYKSHPNYNQITKLKSIIKVYQKGKLIFRGRVLEDTQDFDNAKQVDVECQLAFLLDSVYRPFNLTSDTVSVKEFFTDLINNHNSQVKDFQKFTLGNITVEDPNEKINFSSETALKTWDVIQSRLIENLGGYLHIRYDENEMPIIDYLADFEDTSTQKIEFGKNLLNISSLISGSEIATAIIPYGAKLMDESGNETTERLTIASVNNGVDFIYDEEMVEEYGFIFAEPSETTWDDVTLALNLLNKAKKYLAESVKLSATVELTAVDLANVYDIECFKFCDYVQVLSNYHDINKTYLLKKIEMDLLNPQNTKITLGETYKTITDTSVDISKNASQVITRIENIEKDYTTNETVKYIVNEELTNSSVIEQTAEAVVISALVDYVKQTNFDEYKESNSTELQVLAEQIIANFNTTTASIEEVDGELTQKYQEIYGWIRGYINSSGNTTVEIGDSQANIKLMLESDEIYFDVNGVKRFYLTAEGQIVFRNAIFEETTEIGNGFGFVPRSNGNISFKKVRR